MAFIEKQRHGKHDYYYLVKSVRLSPSKVGKARIFLGRKVPPHGELQAYFRELERKIPKPYAPKWLPTETVERLEDLLGAAVAFRGLKDESTPADFLVRFTYNTNAIEGNPLSLRQTALILADGIVPQGAKTQDVMEVLNGRDAFEFVKAYKGSLSKSFACRIQYEITKNTKCRIQGGYRDSEVRISGSDWKPPAAKEVAENMQRSFNHYGKEKKALHPVELASWLHNSIAQIHPFTDGNGRTARLLMNWVLVKNKLPPVIIEVRNKEEYYKAIEEADKGKQKPFAEFLAKQLLEQYTVFEKEKNK